MIRYYVVISVADTVKSEAKVAVQELKDMDLRTVMITGDNHSTQAIANEVGIDHVIANVLPEDKAKHVAHFQDKGENIAMVGDGINDAPALVQADIGIAMGTGTEVAIEAADITILGGDIALVPKAIHASHKTIRNIKQNLFGRSVIMLLVFLLLQWAYSLHGLLVRDGIKFCKRCN